MDFAIGGSAGMCACLFSNPFDLIKTRQQLQGELTHNKKIQQLPYKGLLLSVKSVIQAEGVRGLQKGLAPALSFQFIMNGTRLGLFQTVDNLKWTYDSKTNTHSSVLCIFWSGIAGIVGSAVGCPLYMVKTQIQSKSHGHFAVGHQHNHSGTIDALLTAYRTKGIRGIWHGFTGIVPRTAVASAFQLTAFTHSKDFLVTYEVSHFLIHM